MYLEFPEGQKTPPDGASGNLVEELFNAATADQLSSLFRTNQ